MCIHIDTPWICLVPGKYLFLVGAEQASGYLVHSNWVVEMSEQGRKLLARNEVASGMICMLL